MTPPPAATASAENGVRRFINASSNHVMGGYKDAGGPYATDADGNAVAPITAASPPEVCAACHPHFRR